ncbi:MAG TPA: hypothetical protein VH683_07525, partial [Thermoleophilaceae bacterium]
HMESCFTTAETYVGCDAAQADIAGSGLPLSTLAISGQSATGYQIVGTSKSGHTFTYLKNGATITKSCTPAAGGGGCNAGSW